MTTAGWLPRASAAKRVRIERPAAPAPPRAQRRPPSRAAPRAEAARRLVRQPRRPSPSRLVPVEFRRLAHLNLVQQRGAAALPFPFEGAGKELHQPPSPRRAQRPAWSSRQFGSDRRRDRMRVLDRCRRDPPRPASAGVDGARDLVEVSPIARMPSASRPRTARSASPRNGRTPAPSIESDRTKAETVMPASLAAASSASNSAGEKRICATLSFPFDVAGDVPAIDTVIAFDHGGCGRRPRIEGLSLDRQEKCITFFRILPTQMIDDLCAYIRIICYLFYINMIVFFHVRVFLYRCESTSTRNMDSCVSRNTFSWR